MMLCFQQQRGKTAPLVAAFSAVSLAMSLSSSTAGTCPLGDAQLAARAALAPSAPQSVAAQMHHQPTMASVAAAEKKLAAVANGAARATNCHAPKGHGSSPDHLRGR